MQPLHDLVPDAKHPLDLVEADLSNKESWVPAVEGCAYVFHVASPFPPPTAGRPDENKIITEAVGGVENVLAACAESGTVKRVVVTSSVAAVSCGLSGNPGYPDDYVYTEDDWSVEDACGPYEKSKLKAERAAWAFVEKLEKDKKFELVVVNPVYIQGPLLSAASGAGTASLPIMLLEHKIPALANFRAGIVDVRDVVAGEIAAMFTPSAAGKRFILCGGVMDFKDFALIMKAEFQSQGYNIPTGAIPKFLLWGVKFFDPTVRAAYPGVNKKHSWSNERMKNELGVTPLSMNQSILDTCYSVIEFGLATKKPGYLGPPEKRDKPPAAEGGEAKPTEGDKTEQTPTEAESKPAEEPTTADETEPKANEGGDPKPSEAGEGGDSEPREGGEAQES